MLKEERLSVGGRSSVTQRLNRRQRREMEVEGRYRVTRYDRETGKRLGSTGWRKNTIQAAGKQLLLDLWIGDSAAHYTNASAELKLYNSSDALQATFTGADTGYPDHGTSGQVTWQWSDISTDQYAADRVTFSNGTTVFSDVGTTGWGSKPDTENWIYEYQLSITTSDSNLSLADSSAEGLDHILHCMTGDSADHFNQASAAIQVESDQSGTVLGTDTGGCDSGYPSRSGTTVTFQWTVAAGVLTGTWELVIVYGNFATDVTLRDEGTPAVYDQFGSKASNAEWVYTYEFSIS